MKVVDRLSSNRYYLAATAELVKRNVSGKLNTVYDCFVGWTDASELSASLASMRFRNMCVSMYKVEKKWWSAHEFESKQRSLKHKQKS